jgi:hypothetical protein
MNGAGDKIRQHETPAYRQQFNVKGHCSIFDIDPHPSLMLFVTATLPSEHGVQISFKSSWAVAVDIFVITSQA